jgi:RHS repeat-associated protein
VVTRPGKNQSKKKKYYMKYIIMLIVVACSALLAKAQTQFVGINGNTMVDPGQTVSYFAFYSHSAPSSSCWTVTNGTIVSSSCGNFYNNPTTSTCANCHGITVRWNTTGGSGTITVRSGSNSSVTTWRNVTIIQPVQVAPVTSVIRIPFSTSPGVLPASVATGGDGLYLYRWQSSIDNNNWSDVGGPANNPWNLTYDPGMLTTGMYYRLRATSMGLTGFSNSLRVEVLPWLSAGEITSSHFIRPGMQPFMLKGTTAKGETGQFTYQWQQSANGTAWSDIGGATGVDYQPPALSSTTWYRRRVTSVNLYNQSNQQFSNVAVVTVRANATGATPTLTTDNTYTQPVKQLVDLPGVTAQHYNRIVNFSAKRPGVSLQSNLLNQTASDGSVGANYADGLNRPIQSISQRATVNNTDVVAAVQYDEFGRTPADFMPYSDGLANAGQFRNNAGTQQRQFYQTQFPGEQFPYSYTIGEDEVEAGVLGEHAPGNVYAGRNISGRTNTRTNTETEQVWRFIIHNGQPALPANHTHRIYGSRDLIVDESYDINDRRLIRYTDLDGKPVMQKLQQNDPPAGTAPQWLVTYNVYDGLGNLRFIIPQTAMAQYLPSVPAGTVGAPVMMNATVVHEQCYVMDYDKWGRLISKKFAGVAADKYIYDKLGRQALSQDAKMATLNQWSFIQFDNWGRPLKTAIYSGGLSEAAMRTAAATAVNYQPAGSYDWQTETFYDNYNFADAASKPFNNAIMGQLASGTDEVVSNQATSVTRGLRTGTKVKVLYPGGVTQGPQWLVTINYYDHHQRIIQSQSDNILGGTDVLAIRYNFTGTVVSHVMQHHNPRIPTGHPTQVRDLQVRKRFEYYGNGKLNRVFQTIGNQPEVQLARLEFNDMDQMIRKTLGNNLEQLNYQYNIQGQLTGINENYVRNRLNNHWWGGTFHFHDGFTNAQADGGMAGLTWRSRGRFDEAHAYGFAYDAQSRLKEAHYSVNTATAPGSTGWTQTKDYTVDNLNYDEAGNMATMRTKSTAWGETRTIDNLTYNYETGTHRLNAVNDAAAPQNKMLTNFKDSVQQAQEYSYDANGNLTEDKNKGFTATWNHLDKPSAISFSGNRHIRYVYDATGERLQKWVDLNGVATSTTYIGILQYQNDTLLQSAAHEAGRLRRNRHGRLVNDFYIDDHLGNVRMVLTSELDTFAYAATFEQARNAEEEATWRNRNTTRDAVTNTTPFFNQPANNQWASRLNGSDANRRIGAGIILRVMSGDTVNIYTRAAYQQAHGGHYNAAAPVSSLVSSLVSAFIGTATGNLDNKTFLPTNGQQTVNTNAFTSLLNHQQANTPADGTPRAFLKAILFDEQLQLVDSVNIRISRGAGQVFEYSRLYNVPKNGFIYVYPMNESNADVWFDDISVTHRTGPLLQESSFYPFGMEIMPLSSYAALKTPNERDFQKNELDQELDLNLHNFHARMYDASIGRFAGVDPKADKFSGISPYNYSGNNPIAFVDPNGEEIVSAAIALFKIGKLIFKGVKAVKVIKAAKAAKMTVKAYKAAKAVAATAKVAKAGKAAGAAANYTKFGKFAKTWFRPIAAGTRNVINNWDNIEGRRNGGLAGVLHFGVAFGGAMLGKQGDDLSFFPQLGWEGLGSLTGGAGSVATNAMLGIKDNDLQTFSRGVTAVISSKFDEKSFKKGLVGKIPQFDPGNSGVNSILGGLNVVSSKYGEYGKDFYKVFGGGAPWKLFLVGAGASAVGDAIDYGFASWANRGGAAGLQMSLSVLTQSFSKDASKNAALYLLPAYQKYTGKNFSFSSFRKGAGNAGLQYLFFLTGYVGGE